ncbi:SDR family oxidoreductase [Halomarina ordinaria]|uniref:SDR family oxidoreductase n=1 Tax=Halomarina ordinaria TaxID=3033939 RepID=A0ABD5UC41_9EURY|nr:SDR family oxidoreductase [Halomarina sp. PSRA2]
MAKTVLITGSSSGIGRETARAFHDDDWTVYATARDPATVADLAERGCETAALDVTDEEQVRATVDAVIEEQGRLDCVVNNAGYGQFGPVEDVPTTALHRQFDVNVYGPHRVVRAALPHMREREEGRIVNVSSVAGRVVTPGMGAYAASKFALEALTDALRNEIAPYDVEAVLVEPGPVETSFAERANGELAGVERSGAYESVYRLYDDSEVFGGQSPVAIAPEQVARTVLEAAVTPDPRARYPVGGFAELSLKARYLPDGARDTAFGLLNRLV